MSGKRDGGHKRKAGDDDVIDHLNDDASIKRSRTAAENTLVSAENEAVVVLDSTPGRGWRTSAEGLQRGRFSTEESNTLRQAMVEYCEAKNVPIESLFEFKGKHSTNPGAWKQIATILPHRSVSSCYFHATRKFHPGNKGPWTAEDIMRLKDLVEIHGTKWSKIGKALNSHPQRCRDKWREIQSSSYNVGPATKEECEQIVQLVQQHFSETQTEPSLKRDSSIPWTKIANQLGTRSAHQCASLWYHRLNPRHRPLNEWELEDTANLYKQIHEQGAETLKDIQWESLSSHWSGHQLRRRFTTLSKSVPGHLHLPLDELLAKLEDDMQPRLEVLHDAVESELGDEDNTHALVKTDD